MKNKLAFIKAVGKTLLGFTIGVLITVLILSVIVVSAFIMSDKILSHYVENTILGILGVVGVGSVIYYIIFDIKMNYEDYIRKSNISESTYEIDYKLIKKDSKIIKAKTKVQAKEKLDVELSNCDYDDCKKIKIKNID